MHLFPDFLDLNLRLNYRLNIVDCLVEHQPSKLRVAGLSPVSRSNIQNKRGLSDKTQHSLKVCKTLQTYMFRMTIYIRSRSWIVKNKTHKSIMTISSFFFLFPILYSQLYIATLFWAGYYKYPTERQYYSTLILYIFTVIFLTNIYSYNSLPIDILIQKNIICFNGLYICTTIRK